MNIKERIKQLMGKNQNFQSLLIDILKLTGEKQITQKKIDSAKGNFSRFLNEDRPFPQDYIIALEKIFKRPFVYLMEGDLAEERVPYKLRNFEYYASLDDYERFSELDGYTDNSGNPIIENCDEFGNDLLDYLLQYRSVNGIRYLAEKYGLKYDISYQNLRFDEKFSRRMMVSRAGTDINLARLLIEKKEYKLFFDIFNPFDLIYKFSLSYLKENLIFYKKEFLDAIIESAGMIKEMQTTQRIAIDNLYQNRASVSYAFKEVVTICPLLTPLLERLIEEFGEAEKKLLEKLLGYAITENEKIIKFFMEKNKTGQFHNGLRFSDNNEGFILDGWSIVGNMVVYPYPIDPQLPEKIKNKLSKIVEQVNKISFSERIMWNGKKTKQYRIINDEYVLINSTDNADMYKMYDLTRKQGVTVMPRYYGSEEGVDKFEYIKGQIKLISSENELMQIVDALKQLHEVFSAELNGKIYVHGGFEDSFIFDAEKLKGIVNWERCRIGEIEDDLIQLIDDCFQMQWDYEHSYNEIFEKIKKIINRYGQKTLKKNFGDKMLKYWEKERQNLDKKASNYNFCYCNIRMKEAFTELYLDKLNNIK